MSIMSRNIRVRYPELLEVGADSIIDDYCYLSGRIKIGDHVDIANNCSVGGGPNYTFSIGDWSSLSAGVRIWLASNDFVSGLIAITGLPGIEGDVRACVRDRRAVSGKHADQLRRPR